MFVSKKKVTALVLTLFMAITFTSACGNEGQSNQKSTNKNADVKGPATIVVTYFPYADHLIALGQVDRLAGVVNLKSLQNFKVYDSYLESGNIVDLGSKSRQSILLHLSRISLSYRKMTSNMLNNFQK